MINFWYSERVVVFIRSIYKGKKWVKYVVVFNNYDLIFYFF